MTSPRLHRSSTRGLSEGAAPHVLALSIVFVLILVAIPPAQSQTFQVLHAFTGGQDGGQPFAGLTMDKAGNLYSTASTGGVNYGTVYQLKHKGSGWVFNILHSLNGASDGGYPMAGVIFGGDGTLFGTTRLNTLGGHGTVFNLKPSPTACKAALCPWTATVVYTFKGPDGNTPGYGNVIFDQEGDLYGTTEVGGPGTLGIVYMLTPSGHPWTENILYGFTGYPDGAVPLSGVVFDSSGNLYGTTSQGGSHGDGAVFQLTNSGSGWTENLLYSFGNGSDGAFPVAGLILDQSGNLYGATSDGGTGGQGTVFELTPANGGWTFSVLYSLVAPPGGFQCGPWGNLVMDGAGDLYGTERCNGASNLGRVFKLTPSGGTWTYTSLHDFAGGEDGKYPYCNVALDAKGNLYGTASAGGANTQGVVWEITP